MEQTDEGAKRPVTGFITITHTFLRILGIKRIASHFLCRPE